MTQITAMAEALPPGRPHPGLDGVGFIEPFQVFQDLLFGEGSQTAGKAPVDRPGPADIRAVSMISQKAPPISTAGS